MEMNRIERQMNFLREIDALKSVFRRNYLSDGSRRENDAEHSWHLAMIVSVLAEHFEGLDVLKTIKMVLIHDIVEIYAGDTFAYDVKGYEDKDEREQAAAARIFSLLPGDQEAGYRGLWEEFEKMETQEAVCASIADRIQPLMLNFASEGKMWKERGVTSQMVLKRNGIVLDKAPESVREYVGKLIREASERGYFADAPGVCG
jgi:putative hydrolase of HD superfamily